MPAMREHHATIHGLWTETGELELSLAGNVPEGAVIRYCFPWDGPRLLFLQGQYLAPVACDPGTEIRARIFLGRKGISEVQAFTRPGMPPSLPTPEILVRRTQNRDFMAYDWAIRHGAVCRAVRKLSPRLLMLGDSITHFWGGEPYDDSPLDYVATAPALWTEYLEGFKPVNLGFGNDRVENALWRVEHGELDGAAPDSLCVILLGTNNLPASSPEDISAGLMALCASVRECLPACSILVQGIYPRDDQGEQMHGKLVATNNLIRSAVESSAMSRLYYADIGSVLADASGHLKPGLTRDGLHPTRDGYREIARVLVPEIERLSCRT